MFDTEKRVLMVKQKIKKQKIMSEKHRIAELSVLSFSLLCCIVGFICSVEQKGIAKVAGLKGATMIYGNAGGYVIVGIVSFILAVIITLLCVKSKNNKEDETK